MSSPCASTQASASCAGVMPFSSAISSTLAASLRFASRFSPWKRGLRAPEVVLVELVGRREAAGEEAAPERRVGDEADAELAAGRQDLRLGVARPQRVLGLQRGDRVRRRGRGGSSPGAASLSPRWRTLPSSTSSRHRADGLLDRRRSGRRGAGSRGRRGRCRGARASPRSSARTFSGEPSSAPTVDMSPGSASSDRTPNLVAITYSSRRPAIALPTSSSFVSGPYISAVSRKLKPSSSARWIVRDRLVLVGRCRRRPTCPCSRGRARRPRDRRACVASLRPSLSRSRSNLTQCTIRLGKCRSRRSVVVQLLVPIAGGPPGSGRRGSRAARGCRRGAGPGRGPQGA